MAENILPNQSTTSLIVNSRLIHRPPQSIPKFLENFEEIPLREKRDEQNQNFQNSNTRSYDQNHQTKDISLSNLQINQSFDSNRNAMYLRSSQQKKKIFEENYSNTSKQNPATASVQNYKRHRTFSTQIYDYVQTDNSFNQVNQSLNVQSFNQNRIHLLSFQDEEVMPQINIQSEKDQQTKIIQEILANFKQEIMKEQSNALDHLRYFVNSNEQKISQLTDQQIKKQHINSPQVTLSKLNQLSQIKQDITQKIQQQISSQIGEKLLKIEENQNTLYEYSKKIKQDLANFFNESINNVFENTFKAQIEQKIDSFQNQMQEKIISFESQQSTIISQQSQESGYISLEAEKKQQELKELENKFDRIKFDMDSICSQIGQKADIQTLQEQFNNIFGEKVVQINEDIKQINDLKEEQKQFQQNLIQMQIKNLEKVENIQNNYQQLEQEQSQFQENEMVSQQQQNKNQFMKSLDGLIQKVKQLNQLHKKLMEQKKQYEDNIKEKQTSLNKNDEFSTDRQQFKETSLEGEQIHDLIVSQNDLDNFITMTIDDEKRQQTREPNPYRKSSKLQDSQIIQKEIQEESNLFRYSTINQNENQNQLQEIHNILSRNQNVVSKPPKQQPKIVFRRKKLSESKVESYQNATNYNSQVEQHNEFPNQEILTFKNVIPCKVVNSLLSSPCGANKEILFNSQQKIIMNQTNQFSNTKNSFRQSLDNFAYSSSRKVQTQENQSPGKEEQTQPISLSQYYKLQINRRSCDFTSYSKSYSYSQEKNIINANTVDKFNCEEYQYKPSQRINTVPSQPESNSILDEYDIQQDSRGLDKRSLTTEVKSSYLEKKIKTITQDITKLPIKFPKQNQKQPILVGVDTPQEAKSDLKKRIIDQKHKKEGNKYLIPSINLNNLQIQIQD
ncbi:hypothetical protein TTHERM_00994090 (macronuclear) [Tetrahymena thermophila SB210]|uniref:Uncharacterized protein n=1 Tax=Tetrahymena thermophila (strain SB210) TaxID=312017 RepID=Q247T8_TETTS|nr:hypothetical protein TTHERM_00994090 [Tetrahymena thermophila SB210]EAS04012.2 hypothetical protein TTHERM_00994090 [Tetrahymena thermophila SB210]|eukprot:XP_001024257.2 hypothetical protein TTHERM_00994090 [Tetrahymena thermophila SB210]